ncbi:MAG: hypothetical protein R2705_01980 [Ilumatobacteraceae bacterium]
MGDQELIERCVDAVCDRDPQLGGFAGEAAESLFPEHELGVLWQASLQRWIWWEVPSTYPQDRWRRLQFGAAALLDELGYDDYADLVRSAQTDALLDLWSESAVQATELARQSMDDSGVEPLVPDEVTARTFRFAGAPGELEGTALAQCQIDLEAAIESTRSGRFELVPGHTPYTPGGRGWRRRNAELVAHSLDLDRPENAGQSWRSLVVSERVAAWAGSTYETELTRWRDRIARHVLVPPATPLAEDSPLRRAPGVEPALAEAATAFLGPVCWLLERCAEPDGLTLTGAGYLPPVEVRSACDRFGWWPFHGTPRSQADVHQIGLLREVLATRRWVRSGRRRLVTTERGRRLLDAPGELWWELVGSLGQWDRFGDALAEALALRLLAGPIEGYARSVGTELADSLAREGWRTSTGDLLVAAIEQAVVERMWWWRILGLVEETGFDGGAAPSMRLAPHGRTVALAFVHLRATRPGD